MNKQLIGNTYNKYKKHQKRNINKTIDKHWKTIKTNTKTHKTKNTWGTLETYKHIQKHIKRNIQYI